MTENPRRTPAEIFMQDQSDAALAEAIGILDRKRRPGPLVERMESQMLEHRSVLLSQGVEVLCPHLGTDRPAVAWWLASSPDLLRCRDCIRGVNWFQMDMVGNVLCDACGRRMQPGSQDNNSATAGWHIEAYKGRIPTIGIVTCCRTCREADQSG